MGCCLQVRRRVTGVSRWRHPLDGRRHRPYRGPIRFVASRLHGRIRNAPATRRPPEGSFPASRRVLRVLPSPSDATRIPCQIVDTGIAADVAALRSLRRESERRVRYGTTTLTQGWRYVMSIIAWIVLGAIAGYLAGFLVKGDEGLGVIGHIVLGIIGALVGGFLAGVLFNSDPIDGPLDISSIVVATIGAIITVVVVNLVTGSARSGRGAV